MRIETFIESNKFQIGIVASQPVPHWDAESLERGVAVTETGMMIATYPDLTFRERSIGIIGIDAGEQLTNEDKANYTFIGKFTLKTHNGFIDVGCIPTICDGTSGRLQFNKQTITLDLYGDSAYEPKNILVKFVDAYIIGANANRLTI